MIIRGLYGFSRSLGQSVCQSNKNTNWAETFTVMLTFPGTIVIMPVMLIFSGPIITMPVMLTFPRLIIIIPVMLICAGPIVRLVFMANQIKIAKINVNRRISFYDYTYSFLVVCTRLYNPLCRSVGRSVTLSFFASF